MVDSSLNSAVEGFSVANLDNDGGKVNRVHKEVEVFFDRFETSVTKGVLTEGTFGVGDGDCITDENGGVVGKAGMGETSLEGLVEVVVTQEWVCSCVCN